jgi:hypothetical protein
MRTILLLLLIAVSFAAGAQLQGGNIQRTPAPGKHRSAISGKYVTKNYAEKHKSTTVKEHSEEMSLEKARLLEALCNLWIGQKEDAREMLNKYHLFKDGDIDFDRLQDIMIPLTKRK